MTRKTAVLIAGVVGAVAVIAGMIVHRKNCN